MTVAHERVRGAAAMRFVGLALSLVLLLLASTGTSQAADATPARSPLSGATTTESLLRALYKAPASAPILLRAPGCRHVPCRVRLLKGDAWPEGTSADHRLLVAAAEPQGEVGHVSGVVLGIGLFQEQGGRWRLKAGSPRVDGLGSYGTAPEIEIIHAGSFGRGVVAKPGFTGQGVTEKDWIVYLPVRSTYRRILTLRSALDHSGLCQPSDRACLADDFTSEISVVPTSDGITVSQVKSGPAVASGSKPTSRWHISRWGRVQAE